MLGVNGEIAVVVYDCEMVERSESMYVVYLGEFCFYIGQDHYTPK